MKKNLTKQEQLNKDWEEYNKILKKNKFKPVSIQEYQNILYGRVKPTKSNSNLSSGPSIPKWANTTIHIQSITSTSKTTFGRTSMMERALQGQENQEVTDEIIRKSKRVGILFNKGGYGYITDETDIKTLGKKSQEL